MFGSMTWNMLETIPTSRSSQELCQETKRINKSKQMQQVAPTFINEVSDLPIIHRARHLTFQRNLCCPPSPLCLLSANQEHQLSKSSAEEPVAVTGIAAKQDHWLANRWSGTGTKLILVYADLFSGLLPAHPSCQRSRLAVVLYLWTFILANLATDLLLPGAFAIKSQLRLPTESSLHKFLNLCFAILASRSFRRTWRLLLAIPEPKMNQKCITSFQLARQWRRNSHQSQLSEQLLRQGDIAKEFQIEAKANTLPARVLLCFAVSSWSLIAISASTQNPQHFPLPKFLRNLRKLNSKSY